MRTPGHPTDPKPPQDRPWYLQEDEENPGDAAAPEEFEAAGSPNEAKASETWQGYLPDFLKRSIAFGSQYIPRSEDVLKSWLPKEVVKELASLPKEVAKEVAKVMLSQADRLKTEILKMVASETHQFLREMKLWDEVRKMLDKTTLEVEMKIRFRSEEGSQGIVPTVSEFHITPSEPIHPESPPEELPPEPLPPSEEEAP